MWLVVLKMKLFVYWVIGVRYRFYGWLRSRYENVTPNLCELCSAAANVSQSISTEFCSSATVVPQSKSTEMWSSAAPFDHDLWYFRHWTNEHLTLCCLLAKTCKPAHSSATLESLKSTRSTKLLEKLLTWAAHLQALTGFVRSLNSEVKAFKTVHSI